MTSFIPWAVLSVLLLSLLGAVLRVIHSSSSHYLTFRYFLRSVALGTIGGILGSTTCWLFAYPALGIHPNLIEANKGSQNFMTVVFLIISVLGGTLGVLLVDYILQEKRDQTNFILATLSAASSAFLINLIFGAFRWILWLYG